MVCELKTGGFGEGKWRDQLILDVEYFLAFGEDGFFEKDDFIGGIGCLGDVFLDSGDVWKEGIDFVLKGFLLRTEFLELLVFGRGSLLEMGEGVDLEEGDEDEYEAEEWVFGSD